MSETVSVLITTEEIDRRLAALAEEITKDYADKTLTLVCALKGAVIFMVDLARKLGNNVEFEFIKVSSYGDATSSSGNVTLSESSDWLQKNNDGSQSDDKEMVTDVAGKHILLVEDIADSGHTLAFLRKYITGLNPASFKVCVLLDKPDRRVNSDAQYDYLGFSIPDEFVVGYGLDYAQRYRNLPFIGVLHFE